MDHLENTLENLAPRIDASMKQMIAEMHLVRTGRLINSVETELISSSAELRLQTSMVDYGVALNRRYRFIDTVIDQNEAMIEQEIIIAVEDDLEQQIDELIKP
jgi:hypothetical protein